MSASMLAPLLVRVLSATFATKLPDLILGSKADRELTAVVRAAISGVLDDEFSRLQDRDALSAILTHAFSLTFDGDMQSAWHPSELSLMGAVEAAISRQINVLGDPSITGIGQSSLELLEVDPAVLSRELSLAVLDQLALLALNFKSALQSVGQVILDERRYLEVERRLDLASTTVSPPKVPSLIISFAEDFGVVPSGGDLIEVPFTVVNDCAQFVQLVSLTLVAVRKEPSEVVRLALPGARLIEHELEADLTAASSVNLLEPEAESGARYVLAQSEAEAFRLKLRLLQGIRYVLVIHGRARTLQDGSECDGSSRPMIVEFPVHSVRVLSEIRRHHGK